MTLSRFFSSLVSYFILYIPIRIYICGSKSTSLPLVLYHELEKAESYHQNRT